MRVAVLFGLMCIALVVSPITATSGPITWQWTGAANITENFQVVKTGSATFTLSFDSALPNLFNPADGSVPGMSPAQYGLYCCSAWSLDFSNADVDFSWSGFTTLQVNQETGSVAIPTPNKFLIFSPFEAGPINGPFHASELYAPLPFPNDASSALPTAPPTGGGQLDLFSSSAGEGDEVTFLLQNPEVVPEPGTLTLIGTLIGFMGAVRRLSHLRRPVSEDPRRWVI